MRWYCGFLWKSVTPDRNVSMKMEDLSDLPVEGLWHMTLRALGGQLISEQCNVGVFIVLEDPCQFWPVGPNFTWGKLEQKPSTRRKLTLGGFIDRNCSLQRVSKPLIWYLNHHTTGTKAETAREAFAESEDNERSRERATGPLNQPGYPIFPEPGGCRNITSLLLPPAHHFSDSLGHIPICSSTGHSASQSSCPPPGVRSLSVGT
jgi:hypothetical protein